MAYDIEWLKNIPSVDSLKAVLRNPAALAEVTATMQTEEGQAVGQELLNDNWIPYNQRTVDPEEAAQRVADEELANTQAAEAAAQAAAEEAAAKAAAEAAAQAAQPKVYEYQVTDEDGRPLGRPTRIVYVTDAELVEKMKTAHVNAVRYAERQKRNKNIDRETAQSDAKVQELESQATAAADVVAKEKDPVKLRQAIKTVTESETKIEQERKANYDRGVAIAKQWVADHTDDYLPVQANTELIQDYFRTHNLVLTYDNLELAYAALESKLAKPARVVATANPPQSTPEAVPAPAASITPPVVTTPETQVPVETTPPQAPSTTPETTPAVAHNAQTTARRPGVNGSLPPGTTTAGRGTVTQATQDSANAAFLKSVDKMSGEEYKRNLKNPEFRAKLAAAGIPDVQSR